MEITLTKFQFFPRNELMLNLMRSFIFLLCTSVFGLSSGPMISQDSKVFVNTDKELSVEEVFDLISDQTDYKFIYHEKMFTNYPRLYLVKGTIKTKDLLDKALVFSDLMHVLVNNNTIELRPNTSKPSFQIVLQGTVMDPEGIPLLDATVIVTDADGNILTGTSTDNDGRFSVGASKGNIVKISYIGYITKEIVVGDETEITVVMEESLNTLEGVVLSTGYQKISEERVTGSFEQIKTKDLDTKIAQSILTKIEGEASGILFDNEDGPIIRGLSTINANNDPLVVVDGFPITQGLNSINPNDIEDITILKDAAAASIWGIRAANGVIVIVTKKGGKNKKLSVEMSTNFAITSKDNLFDLDYASTSSFLEYEKHRADNEWNELPAGNSQPAYGAGLLAYLQLNDGQITQAQADAIINSLVNIDSREEFSDLFMRDQYWSQYNLALSGGGNSNTYRASITYNKNENNGSFAGNETDELLASIRNIFEFNDKLSLFTDVNFISTKNQSNGMNSNDYSTLFQYQQILDQNGNYIAQPRSLSQAFKEQKVLEGYPYNWDYNLKQEFDNKDNETRNTAIRIQTSLDYKILNYLSLKGFYQFEWSNANTTQLFNENTYAVRDLANTFTALNGDTNELESFIGKGSQLRKRNSINRAHQGRLQLNFDKSFDGGKHQVTALAGYEVRQQLSNGSGTTLYGFDPQSLSSINVLFGERVPVTPTGTRSINNPSFVSEREDRFLSYYANTAYTYLNKYTITGSIRLDDTNLFGASEDYRNIPLYSFGGKWDLHNESFMGDNTFLDRLSLRGTYGVNGNADNGTSPFLQATISRNPFTDLQFALISDVKNPELRLEKVFVTNLGLDFGFFNNRISGSLEHYIRKSEDLLAPVSFSSVFGFNSAIINAGKMENKGIDLNLNVDVFRNAAFKYSTTFNFSYNKNSVTEVEVPEQTINTFLNGEPLLDTPLRYLYSYQFAGLDANGDPLTLNENGQIIDVNGQTDVGGTLEDAEITSTDALMYHGTTTPKYYGGWINNISYKNFFFRSLTTFKFGHVFKNTNFLNYRDEFFRFVVPNIHKDFENRWQNPGDENTTTIPRVPTLRNDATNLGYSYYANGDQFVDSASHIRFREIIVGYNLNADVLDRLGISKLSFSFQARNLGLINFNKWNVDPESFILPTQPTYTFNVSANF